MDILNGNFAHEFFQPWNSPVYQNIASETNAVVCICVYTVIVFPEVLLLEILIGNLGTVIGKKIFHE